MSPQSLKIQQEINCHLNIWEIALIFISGIFTSSIAVALFVWIVLIVFNVKNEYILINEDDDEELQRSLDKQEIQKAYHDTYNRLREQEFRSR